jgi:hypothetical protein
MQREDLKEFDASWGYEPDVRCSVSTLQGVFLPSRDPEGWKPSKAVHGKPPLFVPDQFTGHEPDGARLPGQPQNALSGPVIGNAAVPGCEFRGVPPPAQIRASRAF